MQIDFLEALKNYLGVFNIAVHRVSPPYEELVDFDLGLRRPLDPQFGSRQAGARSFAAISSAVRKRHFPLGRSPRHRLPS